MLARSPAQDVWTAPEPMLVPVGDGSRFIAPIGRIDHFRGRWQKLSSQVPERLDELRTVATIESVASSTRIEGVSLTNEEVGKILGGMEISSFRARDEQEVRGYGDLLELIFEQHAELAITENSLKGFHQILLGHSEKDRPHRGEYKSTPNHVERHGGGRTEIVLRTAGPAETRWWMARLVDELNAGWVGPEWHRLVLIADFVLWFLAIHPFQDGNGRLARALTTLLLLKAGYDYVPYASLERVIEENRVRYYVSLQGSQAAVRENPSAYAEWLEFFLGALEAQQHHLEGRVVELERQQGLSPPARRLLDLVTSRGPLTSSAMSTGLGIADRTVRYHLKHLTESGLLVASAPTAGRLYSLPTEKVRSATSTAPVADPVTATATRSIASGALTALDFDATFQRHATSTPNGRAYATIAVGSATPRSNGLGDTDLDAAEAWAASIQPGAKPVRTTAQMAWWRVPDPPRLDRLQMWLHPGPLLLIHWALDGPGVADNARLVLDPVGLVAYWVHGLTSAARFLAAMDIPEGVFTLGLQTQPAGRPSIVDLDFSRTAPAMGSATADSVPPWQSGVVSSPRDQLADYRTSKPALDDLLRHFSYRHTGASVEKTFDLAAHEAWPPSTLPTRSA